PSLRPPRAKSKLRLAGSALRPCAGRASSLSYAHVKISLKVEYACRVLAQLSRSHGGKHLAHIETLAKAEAVPANYLVQILNELRNGGLIVSRRGKQGGYALARPAAEISLYDIVRVVDSEMLEAPVSAAGQSGARVAAVWRDIGASIENSLKSRTVENLISRDAAEMWHI
ncbi:MAG: RrF2 family transcriptional regulator, partial [Gammaproteobacteria bacterium]